MRPTRRAPRRAKGLFNPNGWDQGDERMGRIIPPASIFNSTISPTTNAREFREFWAGESKKFGTDWISLLDAAQVALSRLRSIHGSS